MLRIRNGFLAITSLCILTISLPVSATHTLVDMPTCTPKVLQTLDMFNCIAREELPPIEFAPASSHLDSNIRLHFPKFWHQASYDQQHNPVFKVDDSAPSFLRSGTFWAAPLTGLDYLRLSENASSMQNDEAWGSRTAQYLGNVMGVSVAQGIVYVQLGRHEIWALDAATGKAIWKSDVSTSAGMGQTIVAEINNRIVVYAPVGDASIGIDDAIDFANGKPHDRGGNFSGLYAFDGLTGAQLWHFATKGAARPTPVYREGLLFLASTDGKFTVLDALNGMQLGSFNNPGDGIPGLAAANFYETADERVLLIYGTTRPRRILALDATDPLSPVLAWSYSPPNATANSAGDTPVVVDPDNGVVFTTVISKVSGSFDMNMLALNATSGKLLWNNYAGGFDAPPGFKGSVPMIYDKVVYTGNTSNSTVHAFEVLSGKMLWQHDLAEADDTAGLRHRPRSAPVMYQDKIIFAEGRDIHTYDSKTGVQINLFETNGNFSRWGINQPVIVGNLMILGSVSGWVFAAPVDLITSSPGVADEDLGPIPVSDVPPPKKRPEIFNPVALPNVTDANTFPATSLAFDGGQDHNSVSPQGPAGISWQTALNSALALDAPPKDEALFGTDAAAQKTNNAFGVGSGVSPVNGIVYANSNRFSINALNALTGELIWRYPTTNANMGQPLVTPTTVIVGGGDLWMNLGSSGRFRARSPATLIGDSFSTMVGLDPVTGIEKWTYFSGFGTSTMTPLYRNGNLYWVNGEAKVWAINADNAAPVAEFYGANGQPLLNLGGFNAISSANVFQDASGRDLMLVGTAMPNNIWAIDLATASVVWKNRLLEINSSITGFATVSPAVDQNQGLLISTVLADEDLVTNTVDVVAFALDATTGKLAWSQSLGRGPIPSGFAAPTPMLDDNNVYLHNPLTQSAIALNSSSGTVQWRSNISAPEGKLSWGAGVMLRNQLIVPVGPTLYTLDKQTGSVLSRYVIGGSMTYNSPTVVGETLYVGNAWGWVSAIPLNKLLK